VGNNGEEPEDTFEAVISRLDETVFHSSKREESSDSSDTVILFNYPQVKQDISNVENSLKVAISNLKEKLSDLLHEQDNFRVDIKIAEVKLKKSGRKIKYLLEVKNAFEDWFYTVENALATQK